MRITQLNMSGTHCKVNTSDAECVGELDIGYREPVSRWFAYAYRGEQSSRRGFETRELAAEWLIANATKGDARWPTS